MAVSIHESAVDSVVSQPRQQRRRRLTQAYMYLVCMITPPMILAISGIEDTRNCFDQSDAANYWDCVSLLPGVENWLWYGVITVFGLFLVLPILFWD